MKDGLILNPKFSENAGTNIIKYILGDRYIYLIREEERGLYIKINNYDRDRLGEIYKGEVKYEDLREKMIFKDLKNKEIYKKLKWLFEHEDEGIRLLCRKEKGQLQFYSKYENPHRVELLFVLQLDWAEDKTPGYKKLRNIETKIELLNWELKFLEKEKERVSKEIEEGK